MIDIYLITNQINKKRYIGKTQKGYKTRFDQHCKSYDQGNRNYISCAINKYGKDNFKIELIAQVEDDSWEFWESFYIQEYKTMYYQNGYNLTLGGDSNPMDEPITKEKHKKVCQSDYFRELQRALSLGRKHTEETKQLCRENTLRNLDECTAGFKEYNESKKIEIAMLDDNGEIEKIFSSLSDACRYFNKDGSYSHILKKHADRINKNGKRAKFFGKSWTTKI